jgi:hypothetical protein
LGNTPVSLYTYVYGDVVTKYSLGIPQGYPLGRNLLILFLGLDGKNNSSPTIYVRTHLPCPPASVVTPVEETCFKKPSPRFLLFHLESMYVLQTPSLPLAFPSGVWTPSESPPGIPASPAADSLRCAHLSRAPSPTGEAAFAIGRACVRSPPQPGCRAASCWLRTCCIVYVQNTGLPSV